MLNEAFSKKAVKGKPFLGFPMAFFYNVQAIKKNAEKGKLPFSALLLAISMRYSSSSTSSGSTLIGAVASLARISASIWRAASGLSSTNNFAPSRP